MKLSDFQYHLPEELIAKYPLEARSDSRLLSLNSQTGSIQHFSFKQLPQLLYPGDLLVFNNTKVMPARLYGKKPTGGQVEILIERILNDTTVLAMVRASKKIKLGTVILLENNIEAMVIDSKENFFILEFNLASREVLSRCGEMPLPPYINRQSVKLDQERYQTIYAEHEGAVAAPTAGLHFDNALLDKLRQNKINFAFITLHIGAGTFQPVRTEIITQHKMHSEYINVSKEACDMISETKKAGGRVIAVGTTAVRSIETASATGNIKPYKGDTNIFIYPGYNFKMIDAIITNFHLPESTLLMLVSAFATRERILAAYQIAVQEKYRFFSYGDAMFISKN